MPNSVYLFSLIIGGLVLIGWGANLLVASTENISKKYNISRFMSSFIFIGLATSSPEILISILSSLEGKGNIAIGNALGSNIANISFVFALTILLFNSINSEKNKILSKEAIGFFIILVILSIFIYPVLYDGIVEFYEGIFLLFLFILLFIFYKNKYYSNGDILENSKHISGLRVFSILIVGLAFLLIGTKIFLTGSIGVAKLFGISDYVIGLSIAAIGTSLPELASSIESARKKSFDFIIGNILGSNIFNIAIVVGIVGILDNNLPGKSLSITHINRDMVMMFITMIGFYYIIKNYNQYITKILCLALLISFMLYQFNLYGISI
jgi:cation:H+ antiporter